MRVKLILTLLLEIVVGKGEDPTAFDRAVVLLEQGNISGVRAQPGSA